MALPQEGEEAAALPARLAAAMLQSQFNPAAVQAVRATGECNQPFPPYLVHPNPKLQQTANRCGALQVGNAVFLLQVPWLPSMGLMVFGKRVRVQG